MCFVHIYVYHFAGSVDFIGINYYTSYMVDLSNGIALKEGMESEVGAVLTHRETWRR